MLSSTVALAGPRRATKVNGRGAELGRGLETELGDPLRLRRDLQVDARRASQRRARARPWLRARMGPCPDVLLKTPTLTSSSSPGATMAGTLGVRMKSPLTSVLPSATPMRAR